MYKIFSFLAMALLFWACQNPDTSKQNEMDWTTPFEKDENNTATYLETIAYYENLKEVYPNMQFTPFGKTDSGYPLHVAVISKDALFTPEAARKAGRMVLMINNAIHPGEPCGVDATMMLFRDYLQKKELSTLLEDVVIVAIPFYNIGGGLNRGSYSRANQQGPKAYGFRGNARNLDLNRDFVKCDSRNARAFNQIFNHWNPDVLVDNHTSNGADYQYTMTLIATQHNKLETPLAEYLNDHLLPTLYKDMKTRNWEMTPYVNARTTPDEGISGFLDLPRYSSGYAALFNTLSFMPETHMLKPYKDRVHSTYAFMDVMIKNMGKDKISLLNARKEAVELTRSKAVFDLKWTLDKEKVDTILFKGYEAKYKPSTISGKDRLYYDRNAPYEKNIPFYNHYTHTKQVQKPSAYILPQAYGKIAERMQWNGVTLNRLRKDEIVETEFYRIKDFKTTDQAYEGHYLHSEVKVEIEKMKRPFFKGDYVIFTDQPANKYIIETLEPQGPDSFFAWNFFDGILMQKEYFSSYVFEDLAEKILDKNPELREKLEAKKSEDAGFADSPRAQLDFVYKNSPHYEPTHRLFPVGRIFNTKGLPLE